MTGSGRERQFAAPPVSRRSTRGPLPAKVGFLAPPRTHAVDHQPTVATGSFLASRLIQFAAEATANWPPRTGPRRGRRKQAGSTLSDGDKTRDLRPSEAITSGVSRESRRPTAARGARVPVLGFERQLWGGHIRTAAISSGESLALEHDWISGLGLRYPAPGGGGPLEYGNHARRSPRPMSNFSSHPKPR